MEEFDVLCSKWKKVINSHNLQSLLNEKLLLLLKDSSETGVLSSIALLRSFGEEAFSHVLSAKGEQLELRSDLPIANTIMWEMKLLEHVCKEGSPWFSLHQQDAFALMESHVCGEMEWSRLPSMIQKKVVNKALSMVPIPNGSFMMGASDGDEKAWGYEKPRHRVTLTQGFEMCRFACTQGLYEHVMGNNPSHFTGATRPVDSVSWCDAVLFCNKLSELQGLEPVYIFRTAFQNDDAWSKKVRWYKKMNGYRLPTEAEWEYSAHADEEYLYPGSENATEIAWHRNNSAQKTHPVGQKTANAWGLHDMSGNVWEWCWEPFAFDAYKRGDCTDPRTAKSSPARTLRGGSWYNSKREIRLSYRFGSDASARHNIRGFRVVRTKF